MPTVVSATVSAEHTLQYHYDKNKGFPVTKPSMLLDIRIKFIVFIFSKKKYLSPPLDEVLCVYKYYLIHEQPVFNSYSSHAEASCYSSET